MGKHHHDHGPIEEQSADQLIGLLARRIRFQRMSALEPYGLAVQQARAFSLIARYQGSTKEFRPSALAEHLRIARRSATELIDTLADKGLVERTPSSTDRRATVLSITELGARLRRRMHADAERAGREQAADMLSVLSAEELDTLTSLLRRVAMAGTDPEVRRE